MTVNTKCYYNSLRRDWEELKVSVMFVISLIIGGCIGYVFSNEIVPWLIFLSGVLTFSEVSLTITFIVLVSELIFDIAGETRDKAKSQSCISNMLGVCIITIGAWFGTLILYVVCIGIFSIPVLEQNRYAHEMAVGIIVLCIVGIIATPFALAYARCNDEPEDAEKSGAEPLAERVDENKNR